MFKRTLAAAAALFFLLAGPTLAEDRLYESFQRVCAATHADNAAVIAAAGDRWKPMSNDLLPPGLATELSALHEMKIFGLPTADAGDWKIMMMIGDFYESGKAVGPACIMVALKPADTDMAAMKAWLGGAQPMMQEQGVSAYLFVDMPNGRRAFDPNDAEVTKAASAGKLFLLMSGQSEGMTMFGYIAFLHVL